MQIPISLYTNEQFQMHHTLELFHNSIPTIEVAEIASLAVVYSDNYSTKAALEWSLPVIVVLCMLNDVKRHNNVSMEKVSHQSA